MAWLELKTLDPLLIHRLKTELTIYPHVSPRFKPTTRDYQPIILWKEDRGFLGVPRAYFLQRAKTLYDIEWKVSEGRDMSRRIVNKFAPKMREEQRPVVQAALDRLQGKGDVSFTTGGIIRCRKGFGKTLLGLEVAYRLGMRTLIIVQTDLLAEQWEQAIKDFYPGARIGRIQGKTVDYDKKDYTVAMLQTLMQKKFTPLFFWEFGTVITDEVNRLGAPEWSRVAPMFKCKYRIGLTATLDRFDHCEKVFLYHIGQVMAGTSEVQDAEALQPKILRVFTDFELFKSSGFDPDRMSRETLLKPLVRNRERNNLIVRKVMEAYDKGRNILVLTERLEQITTLRIILKAALIAKGENTSEIGVMIGQMKLEDIRKSAHCRIIIATFQYFSVGGDVPRLDTLFFATPKVGIDQSIGRILREMPEKVLDDHHHPIVVDFVDWRLPVFRKDAIRRSQYYREHSWVIGDTGKPKAWGIG
jgi:superfamily II DNA or RNA helicase